MKKYSTKPIKFFKNVWIRFIFLIIITIILGEFLSVMSLSSFLNYSGICIFGSCSGGNYSTLTLILGYVFLGLWILVPLLIAVWFYLKLSRSLGKFIRVLLAVILAFTPLLFIYINAWFH